MPRIAGKDLPKNKKVAFSLTAIYGIGINRAKKLVKQAKIDPSIKAYDLTSTQVSKLQKLIEDYTVEGDLRRQVSDNINRLKRIKCYRGIRHISGLPVRGQRTRTNARTKRSGRKTVGAMTKEMAAKLENAKKAKGKE